MGSTFSRRFDPRGKTVLVTGASSGIGEAVALWFAVSGARLVLTARRKEELERVARQCTAVGAQAVTIVVADLATSEGCQAVGEGTRLELGDTSLDCVVLNAGLSMGTRFQDLCKHGQATSVLQRLMSVNFFGATGVLESVFDMLLASPSGVRILVVSSVIGLVAPPLRTGYAASKFALKGFFDSLRCELSDHPHGASITLGYPGAVRTHINDNRIGTIQGQATNLDLQKSMTPERVASILCRSACAGQRDVLFSLDGTVVGAIKARVIRWIHFLAPGLADMLTIATMKSMSAKAKSDKLQ